MRWRRRSTETEEGAAGERCVIFLHLPKTAGSTLVAVMRGQYREHELAIFRDDPSARAGLRAMNPAARRGLRAIRGHVLYGIHELLEQPWTYITLLRDPVERVLSLYGFVREAPGHRLHEHVLRERIGLVEFVRSGMAQTMDAQVRRVAGVAGRARGSMVRRAVRNLRRDFAVVGLTERFDDTLRLLEATLGWTVRPVARVNVTRDRLGPEDLSAAELAAIRDANRRDLELYEAARTMFEERVAALGPRTGERLADGPRRDGG